MNKLDELKNLAEELGYTIVKKRETIKLLPCVCGGKRSIRLWCNTKTGNWFYMCKKCEFTASEARTKYKAKIEWNKAIENKMKEERQ